MSDDDKQCRICLDGPAQPDLGRLIRPCLCKGSISFVHVRCLQKWRTSAPSKSAFFACPQCHYRYRFARTRIVGLATNPVVVGGLSGLLFTVIVMMASFVTTYFMSGLDEPSDVYYPSSFYYNPFDIIRDLVRAALRILQDGDATGVMADTFSKTSRPRSAPLNAPRPESNPGLLMAFFRRFVLGLPIVGAGSLVHMLISIHFMSPIHWLARYRGNRRRSGSRDVAALIIVALLLVGIARAIFKVYQLTQSLTKRLLLRAEDAILEVN